MPTGGIPVHILNHLAESAHKVVVSELPFPVSFTDSSVSSSHLRLEFVTRARDHGIDSIAALRNAVLGLSGPSKLWRRQPTGVPYDFFSAGSDSPNILINSAAALALKHTTIRPFQPIIAACCRLPLEEGQSIAKALLCFDSSERCQ